MGPGREKAELYSEVAPKPHATTHAHLSPGLGIGAYLGFSVGLDLRVGAGIGIGIGYTPWHVGRPSLLLVWVSEVGKWGC